MSRRALCGGAGSGTAAIDHYLALSLRYSDGRGAEMLIIGEMYHASIRKYGAFECRHGSSLAA